MTKNRLGSGEVLDLLPHAIFWKDLEGHFLGCNAKCASDMGFASPSEAVGKTDYDVPHFSMEEIAFFMVPIVGPTFWFRSAS
jgi:hypothetical protein